MSVNQIGELKKGHETTGARRSKLEKGGVQDQGVLHKRAWRFDDGTDTCLSVMTLSATFAY